MRRIAFILGAIFSSAVGLYLSISNRTYSPFLNVSIAFVVWGSFYYGSIFGFILSAIVCVAIIVVSAYCVGLPSGLYGISAVLLIPCVMRGFDQMFKRYEGAFAADIKEREKSYNALSDKRDSIMQINKEIECKISELSSVYDMTKEMSALFDLEDIIKILAQYIRKNFTYKRCILAFTRRGDFRKNFRLGYEVYTLQDEGVNFDKVTETDETMKFIEEALLVSGSKPVLKFFEAPHAIMAYPLLGEKDCHGIIFMEQPNEKDIEKFAILSNQLALELERLFLYEEIQELAIRDWLTGVYNRRHFLERFDEELERSRVHNLNISLLLLDIDHFKELNDAHGHLLGDVVLREVASTIKNGIRELDLLGRYGGEEFCVALVETSKEGALGIGERIRLSIQEKVFKAYDEEIKITVSIGVASFPRDGRDTEGLIEAADKALYRAKEAGRNIVSV